MLAAPLNERGIAVITPDMPGAGGAIIHRNIKCGGRQLEAAFDGMKLLVYYSGHGQPDPSSKEAYLLPVDASPRNMSTSFKLSKFYQELIAYNPGSVTVFLDACFSGAKKDGNIMDKEARGVIIIPKEEAPANNMVIFAACSGVEIPKPIAQGISVLLRTTSVIAARSVLISLRTPVTPRLETT